MGKHNHSAEHGFDIALMSSPAEGERKLAQEAREELLRHKLKKHEDKYQLPNSRFDLRIVQEDRRQLADVLFSHGKISEAEKLFQDCTRAEEAKNGTLDNAVVRNLLGQWVGLEIKNRKVAQVRRSMGEAVDSAKEEIDHFGVSPKSWLVKALNDNRVLSIGEDHTFVDKNSHREFLSTIMGDLKSAGATHLAVEFPAKYQQVLDGFLNGEDWQKTVPVPSSELQMDQRVVLNLQDRQDLQQVLRSAHQAGLKVIAVDSAEALNRGRTSVLYGSERDKFMAEKMAGILRSDAQSKVVFFGGALHAAANAGEVWHDSAGEILQKKGYKLASVTTIIPESEIDHQTEPLYPMTDYVKKPVAVPISQAKILGEIPVSNDCSPGNLKFNAWDAVIIYPNKK